MKSDRGGRTPLIVHCWTMLVLSCWMASALGVEEWVSKGPAGGFILVIGIHPEDPQTIFAGTRGGGVYRSSDGGEHWTAANDGLLDPSMDSSVDALVFDPVTPSTLYIGTWSGGVFRSTDSGGTWTSVTNGYLSTYDDRHVMSLAIDPQSPSTVYAGTYAGIWRSQDGGETWTALDPLAGESLAVQTIILDPAVPSTLYVGTLGGGAFRSTDSGQNWVAINQGLDSPFVQALVIRPGTSPTIFAGTGNGVFQSRDGGDTWTPAKPEVEDLWILSLAVDPGESGILYAGSIPGLYRSPDGGRSWSDVILPGYGIRGLAIRPADPSTVYAGSSGGVFRSSDSGTEWTPINSGLIAVSTFDLKINPRDSSTLYAGSLGGGVYRSRNRAESWETVNTGLTNLFVHGLVIDPDDPSLLYAGTEGGVFVSTDEGDTWTIAGDSPRDGVFSVAVNPLDTSRLFASTYDQGIYRSTDSGKSWVQVNSSIYVPLLAIDPQTPTTLYAGTLDGLIRSDDEGETWGALPDIGNPYSLVVDPVNPSMVYAGTDWDLYRSADRGDNWTPAGTGLPGRHSGIFGLAIDPVISSTLYSWLPGKGAFRTRDSGGVWTAISDGLTHPFAPVLAVDPLTPSRVYAGTDGGSVFAIEFEDRELYFAQIGNGAGQLASQLIFFGIDESEDTNSHIRIRDDQGQPLSLNLDGELVPGQLNATVPASGLRILNTDGVGPVTAGSVATYADRAMAGVTLLEGSIGVAGVGNSTPLRGGFIAPMEASTSSEISTGIALMNLSGLGVELQLELCDLDGKVLDTTALTLPAYGRLARYVHEFDWNQDTGLREFRGLLKVASNREIAATVIQTRPGELATMPATPRQKEEAGPAGRNPAESLALKSATEAPYELRFAQFGNGGDLLFSQILLMNPDETSAAVANLHLRDDDGQPLSVELNGQPVNGELQTTIPAGGLRFFETDGSGPVQAGTVTVTSDRALAGVVIFGGSSGVAGVGSSQALTEGFLAPVLNSTSKGTNTGIAVMNLNDEETSIHLSLLDSQGQPLSESRFTLPGKGHRARFVNELSWSDEIDLADFQGLLKAESSGRIAAVVIQTRPGKLATLPVAPR